MNCAFVSSFSSEFSMSRTTSCGNLAPICCDLLLVELVDISHPLKKCDIHNTIKVNRTKDLSCGSPYFMVNFTLSLWEAKMTKPAGATNTNGPLTTTVNVDNEAAMKNSITHPQGRDSHNPKKFTWRFLALSTAKPRQITIEATTEREARQQSPAGFVMVFAGRLPVQEASHE
ncbi:host cell division inhibitor Icd-like protein [Enterobacter asburiae]|uniref:host cell division inhibitor Icd-like protein n=1 Tax=Enterobacter asburiae TaxID=61645 RepID=UPI003F55A205